MRRKARNMLLAGTLLCIGSVLIPAEAAAQCWECTYDIGCYWSSGDITGYDTCYTQSCLACTFGGLCIALGPALEDLVDGEAAAPWEFGSAAMAGMAFLAKAATSECLQRDLAETARRGVVAAAKKAEQVSP